MLWIECSCKEKRQGMKEEEKDLRTQLAKEILWKVSLKDDSVIPKSAGGCFKGL